MSMLSSLQMNMIFHRMTINFADYDCHPEYSVLFPVISEYLMKLSYQFDGFTTSGINLESLLEEIYKEMPISNFLKWNEEKRNYKRAQYFFCTLAMEYILVVRNLFEIYNSRLQEISQTKEKQELAFQLFDWIVELFYEYFHTKNTQGICLRVAERLEGLNQEYVKGGGEKGETSKRVERIRQISGVPKAKRAPCKRNPSSSKQQKKLLEVSKNFNPVFFPVTTSVVSCSPSTFSSASNNDDNYYLSPNDYLSDEEALQLLDALEMDPPAEGEGEAADISSGSKSIDESIEMLTKKQRLCDYQHNDAAISVKEEDDELLDSLK